MSSRASSTASATGRDSAARHPKRPARDPPQPLRAPERGGCCQPHLQGSGCGRPGIIDTTHPKTHRTSSYLREGGFLHSVSAAPEMCPTRSRTRSATTMASPRSNCRPKDGSATTKEPRIRLTRRLRAGGVNCRRSADWACSSCSRSGRRRSCGGATVRASRDRPGVWRRPWPCRCGWDRSWAAPARTPEKPGSRPRLPNCPTLPDCSRRRNRSGHGSRRRRSIAAHPWGTMLPTCERTREP